MSAAGVPTELRDGSQVLVRQPTPSARPAVPGGGARTPEAERAFDAAVRWFLTVSRAA